MQVVENSVLSLNFQLELESGELVDSNFDAAPLRYEMGSGDMLPGFEQAMLGMRAGEQRSVLLPAAQAFGPVSEDNIQRFPAGSLPADVQPERGLVLSFSDAAGGELPGVVIDYDAGYVTVDFNHPLAGRDIRFTARLHAILER